LQVEKVRGGNGKVWFACGHRVFALFQASLERDRALTKLLDVAPPAFEDRITQLKKQNKELMKAQKKLEKEMRLLSIQEKTQ